MAKISKVNLYGYIESWSENAADRFIKRFDEAVKNSDVIELHIHSGGGLVFEGNLIYNHIRKSPVPVDVYIDGIAASMGAIIALAGRKIFMSENAFFMTHAPSGGVWGTADDMVKCAKCLVAMEKQFKKVFKSRTGKSDEEIQALLVGDNWFSADEALEFGFIDAIVDVVDIPEPLTDDVKNLDVKSMFSRYTSLVSVPNNSNQVNKIKTDMDKKSLIAKFGLQGVTEQSSDAEIESAIEAKIQEERTEKEKLQNQIAEGKKQRITAMIEAALVEGKITKETEASFRKIGEDSGEETLKAALSVIVVGKKVAPASVLAQVQQGGTQNSRADWNWERWQKEDPEGLAKLPYEQFNALYKAEYHVDAPM